MGNQVSSNSLRLDRMAGLLQLSYSGAWGATLEISGLVEVNGSFYEFTEETPTGTGDGVAVVPSGTTAALVYIDPDDYESAPLKNGYYDTATGANRQVYETNTTAGILEIFNGKSKSINLSSSGVIHSAKFNGGEYSGLIKGRRIQNTASGGNNIESSFWNKIMAAFPNIIEAYIPCTGVYAAPDGASWRNRICCGVYIDKNSNFGTLFYSREDNTILGSTGLLGTNFAATGTGFLGVDIIIC